jgi:hypothetical protein
MVLDVTGTTTMASGELQQVSSRLSAAKFREARARQLLCDTKMQFNQVEFENNRKINELSYLAREAARKIAMECSGQEAVEICNKIEIVLKSIGR